MRMKILNVGCGKMIKKDFLSWNFFPKGNKAQYKKQEISELDFLSKKRKGNKAQMKIQQMAFMLIAIMVFFALVGLLIVSVKFSGLKQKATDLQGKNAQLLVSKLANSPEFSCGDAFGNGISCVDSDKVMALKNNIDKYHDFWDVSAIEIRKIYPEQSKDILCESNYPECNRIQILSGQGIAYSNFVILCRKSVDSYQEEDICELAKLMVSYKNVQ